jgi:C-terminal processing protease CtpA/Prc
MLIVLVSGEFASAAELFARVVQLQKTRSGNWRSSEGAVAEARDFDEWSGTDSKIYYGIPMTAANLIMTDGKSLENTGVAPDNKQLPSATDLADGKDPVLSHALQAAVITINALAAGKLFPYEWPDL